jgi:hypothetical protein
MNKLPLVGRSPAPRSLSDFPTLRGALALPAGQAVPLPTDLERTLPMEPVILAQLCAATQVSARRRMLPPGLEYSVHLELTPTTSPQVIAPPPSPAATPQPSVGARLRHQLSVILACCAGLGLGMCVAWRIDMTGAKRARSLHPPITAPASRTLPADLAR